MTRQASWWLDELAGLGYPVGEPLGGHFPSQFPRLLRTAAVFAFLVSGVPIIMVLHGAPPLGLIGVLFPIPFVILAWTRANSLDSPLCVTRTGLVRSNGTMIAWDQVQSIRVRAREISIVWVDQTGSTVCTVRPRRRDVGDTRIETTILPPPDGQR